MSRNFGNVSNILLKDVVNDKRFQKYWQIKKDDIEGCKLNYRLGQKLKKLKNK